MRRCLYCDDARSPDAATTTNAYIATMLISSGVLIIRCDDVYNTAAANARS